MESQIKTIKIKADNEQCYVLINECDFNDKIHTLYSNMPVQPVKRTRRKAIK